MLRSLFLAAMLLPGAAIAASFDCAKAKSDAEKLVCANEDLSQGDDELAGLYRRAKQIAPDPSAFKAENIREWKRREALCHDKACVVQWYAQRRARLQAIVQSGPGLRFVRVREFGLLGCSDFHVLPELEYLEKHDPDRFERVAVEGGCSPISSDVKLELESTQTFKVPAGSYEIGYVKLTSSLFEGDPPTDSFFFVLAKDLVPWQ